MIKKIFTIILLSNLYGQNIASTKAVENVLNKLHLFAAEAKSDDYMKLFSDNAVFFGTDIKERWPKLEFDAYATKRMASGIGWTYFMTERNIFFSDDKKIAWFDEILFHEIYGNFRGTGVLKIVNNEWKIAQYNLLLPIPNDLMKKYAMEIKAYYEEKK